MLSDTAAGDLSPPDSAAGDEAVYYYERSADITLWRDSLTLPLYWQEYLYVIALILSYAWLSVAIVGTADSPSFLHSRRCISWLKGITACHKLSKLSGYNVISYRIIY